MSPLRQCVDDLLEHGRLIVVEQELDPQLEVAEVQRRVYRSNGPALLLTNVRGCRFPCLSNLFGSLERARFVFRRTIEQVRRLIELKSDPASFAADPLRYWQAPWTAWRMLPKRVRQGPVGSHQCSLRDLPQLVSWPRDGGPFVTLPQVYTEHPDRPGPQHSNLGMYRVQLAGNRYVRGEEAGLHYQIHRGIGVHHTAALRRGEPLPVNIFVGGSPAMTLAAVMPLPEGLSELTFAGALGGRRIPMVHDGRLPYYADADFCIRGEVAPRARKPEGPFGDHLGYYSLQHDFPVLRVKQVMHRPDPIWPLTVVGRPPQEDTTFGELIHELTGPVIPSVLPGVHEVNAVDAAGVHPLLLAVGSERYTPDQPPERPQELLTQANAILGQGQMSLAKYLWIGSRGDDESLSAKDVAAFFAHILRRVDWRRDLHFQTCTTIDTLDYSGGRLNQGSKLVVAAAGPAVRELPRTLPARLRLPEAFGDPRVPLPGVLAVRAPACGAGAARRAPAEDLAGRQEEVGGRPADAAAEQFCRHFTPADRVNQFPLVVLVDDSDFAARSLENWLWVVFTRSNPADDVHGIGSRSRRKHWGCQGSLVIDARIKPHHAPVLSEDPETVRRVDALAAAGGPLAPYL